VILTKIHLPDLLINLVDLNTLLIPETSRVLGVPLGRIIEEFGTIIDICPAILVDYISRATLELVLFSSPASSAATT